MGGYTRLCNHVSVENDWDVFTDYDYWLEMHIDCCFISLVALNKLTGQATTDVATMCLRRMIEMYVCVDYNYCLEIHRVVLYLRLP